MSPRRIEMKEIENKLSRQVAFSKRRDGLLKKARELAILCAAEVAVIIFSSSGKMFEYSNSDMTSILAKFNKCLESKEIPAVEYKPEVPKEADDLKQEMEKLKLKQLQLLGKDLSGLDLEELHALERELNFGLFSIRERKEQILIQQLAQSRLQVEELQGFNPSTSFLATLSVDDYLPQMTSNVGPADKDSDTIMQMGYFVP
ncbi:hypothetical protein Pfo_001738 [Paulownia fortunei]|nr:hypothetical protein Pfo_001738 [Paulownia fortunei]